MDPVTSFSSFIITGDQLCTDHIQRHFWQTLLIGSNTVAELSPEKRQKFFASLLQKSQKLQESNPDRPFKGCFNPIFYGHLEEKPLSTKITETFKDIRDIFRGRSKEDWSSNQKTEICLDDLKKFVRDDKYLCSNEIQKCFWQKISHKKLASLTFEQSHDLLLRTYYSCSRGKAYSKPLTSPPKHI
jgi:hypothetical protein